MEMRKFIIELHTDGSMIWAEYTEPRDAGYADVVRKCRKCVEEIEGFGCSGDYWLGLCTAYKAIAKYCEGRVK